MQEKKKKKKEKKNDKMAMVRQRYQLIPSTDSDDQRILESDWTSSGDTSVGYLVKTCSLVYKAETSRTQSQKNWPPEVGLSHKFFIKGANFIISRTVYPLKLFDHSFSSEDPFLITKVLRYNRIWLNWLFCLKWQWLKLLSWGRFVVWKWLTPHLIRTSTFLS